MEIGAVRVKKKRGSVYFIDNADDITSF